MFKRGEGGGNVSKSIDRGEGKERQKQRRPNASRIPKVTRHISISIYLFR